MFVCDILFSFPESCEIFPLTFGVPKFHDMRSGGSILIHCARNLKSLLIENLNSFSSRAFSSIISLIGFAPSQWPSSPGDHASVQSPPILKGKTFCSVIYCSSDDRYYLKLVIRHISAFSLVSWITFWGKPTVISRRHSSHLVKRLTWLETKIFHQQREQSW